MAIVYCNDDGSETSPYETLAKAAKTFLVAVDQLAAGDDLYIGMDHAEAPGLSTVYTFPGTAAAPNRVISINTTTEDYDKADNVQVDLESAGAFDMTINGHVKFYGVSFKIGDDVSIVGTLFQVEFYDSLIEIARASGALWSIGGSGGQSVIKFKDTEVNFSGGGLGVGFVVTVSSFEFRGGKISWSGTQADELFAGSGRKSTILLAGTDISDISSALVDVAAATEMHVELHHCLINSSLSLANGTISNTGTRLLMSGCDDTTGNKLYRLEYIDYYGSTVHDDDIFVTTDGAKDPDGNKISWKIATTGNAREFSEPHISPPIPIWVNSTGSKTFTIKGIWDSAVDIQTDQAWIEVEFLDTASGADTQSSFENDGDADIKISIDGNSVDQDNNTETWTGTSGFTNENKIDLAVTATVNRVGPALCRIHVAKPSTTFYADPKVIVT